MSKQTELPRGAFPTMITPFKADKSVDYDCLRALTDWYIANGCTGLFSVCQSSEMYFLTPEERLKVAKTVMEQSAGRATVIACGTFAGPVEDQAAFTKEMAGIVDAVVVLVNQLAPATADDEAWKSSAEQFLGLTGDIPLGLYECPKPYHRLLSAELLGWCAATGRFLFHKDTCCRAQAIRDKLAAVKPFAQFGFYNANAATLRMSLQHGGRGFSGICANFYPQVVAWLCANPDAEGSAEVQHLMAVWENVVCSQYPRSAKYYLSLHDGLDITTTCRNECGELNEEAQLKLQSLKFLVDSFCVQRGIPAIAPKRVS